MIDVSGNYPKEELSKLVKTAKAIVAQGACAGINCGDCPASCPSYHLVGATCVDIKGGESTESIAQEWFKEFIKEYGKETTTMTKKEQARKELDEIMRHAEMLKAIIDEPESDPRLAWIGKWGFYSDDDPECPDDGFLRRLEGIDPGRKGGDFIAFDEVCYLYFRPATPEELGAPASIEPDWSEAPDWARYWAMDADGFQWWYAEKPSRLATCWNSGGREARLPERVLGWRNTLRERPEAAK